MITHEHHHHHLTPLGPDTRIPITTVDHVTYFARSLSTLAAKSMHFPDWIAPFHADAAGCCLRLNHVAGKGCKKSDCTFHHACMMCGRTGHGAFEKGASDGPKL